MVGIWQYVAEVKGSLRLRGILKHIQGGVIIR